MIDCTCISVSIWSKRLQTSSNFRVIFLSILAYNVRAFESPNLVCASYIAYTTCIGRHVAGLWLKCPSVERARLCEHYDVC